MLSLSEGESGGQIGLEVLNLLDVVNQRGIESRLVRSLGLNLSLLFLGEFGTNVEELAGVSVVLGSLNSLGGLSSEESIVNLASIDSSQVNLGAGGDDVSLVNSSEWNTVQLVWASDQEESALELLQEDDSSSLESTSQDDEDGSRGNAGSEGSWLRSPVSSFEMDLLVVSRVEKLGSWCLGSHLSIMICTSLFASI